jgi:cation:H+ antiporter
VGFDIFMMVLSLALILLSCTVFVNAIECLGDKYRLHQGIVGSIFAAVGTALPETVIPIIALIFTKGNSAHDVGIGAIAGAPFMLYTLAFFITGLAVLVYGALGKRRIAMTVDASIMSKDLVFFLIIYGSAIAVSVWQPWPWLKNTIAVILLCSYGLYLKLIIGDEAGQVENVKTLYAQRICRLKGGVFLIMLQVAAALSVIVLGSHLFIHYIQNLALVLNISPLILSLIITPIATEMPEKFNSVVWIGRKKDTLALGNITGAMVFQSCFPVVFGMLVTPWHLRGATLLSALLALFSGGVTLLYLRFFKNLNPFILLFGGVCYALFLLKIF